MATKRLSRQFGWFFRLMVLSITGVLVIASATPQSALSQSTDEPWAVPLNLSHSGAATNPAIIIDSGSVVHVVWQDEFMNYVYARFDGSQWSAPQRTNLHLLFGLPASKSSSGQTQAPLYTGPNPFFVAGPGQYITAFWLTPEGALYASRVINSGFMDVSAWEEAKLLSPSAASFSVSMDALGEFHLAYLRTFDDSVNPAGIYYLQSKNSGLDWGLPVLLYESPYFRRLSGGEANLSLATAGTAEAPLIFIAWDNRPRKQVLLVRSADGGTSWEQPVLVVGPEQDSGLSTPFNIHVGAMQNSVVLVWQNTNQGGACAQFFQYSGDAGATWSTPQSMSKELPGCPKTNEFVAGQVAPSGDFLFLLTEIQGQVFLSAWNGSVWSEPQEQPILSGFEDPEIYTQVEYDCHRAVTSVKAVMSGLLPLT
jgi:hypothetical protein